MSLDLRQIMKTPIIASPDSSLVEAARSMDLHRFSSLPVQDTQGRLIGVLTKTDLLHYALQGEDRFVQTTVGEAMNPSVVCCPPTAPITDVAELMRTHHIHHVFVTEDQRLVGVVSSLDMAMNLLEVCRLLGEVGSN
ncbi:MAG: CBS domain-containing protein [Planctomycetes bacterium]|nr:CBS domain-containing protein [Planctomycetota bacterium]